MRFIVLFYCLIFISCKDSNKLKQHFPDEHINQVLTNDEAISLYQDGLMFGQKGEFDKAIKAYNKAFEFEQSPIILNQLGAVEAARKNYQKSIDNLKKGRELDSLFFPLYISEARLYGILNQFDDAEQILFKLKSLTHSEYWNSYADLYLAVIYYNSRESCEKIYKYLNKSKSIKQDVGLRKQYLDFQAKVKKTCS
jgi:tetratricopeptide (TPR) repeat protein